MLVGWAALACAGGGIDLGTGLGGPGPTAAAFALALAAPAAAIGAWTLRDRGELRTWPSALVLAGVGASAIWSALSISWAAAPDLAWLAANRGALALCVLVISLAISVRVRRPGLGLALGLWAASGPVVGWALATKLVPPLAGDRATGRLQDPLGYWNALALVCAIAIPGALAVASLSAGRRRRAWCLPLAAVSVTLLGLTCVLTLSRSGLLVAVLAAALALVALPERPRVAAAGLAGVLGAILPAVYALTTDALSADELSASAREPAARELAWRLAVGLVVAAGIAVLLDRGLTRRAARARAVAAALVVAVALALGGLLPNAPAPALAQDVPAQTQDGTVPNDPSRLTDTGANLRWRWWGEAARGWLRDPVVGAGAGGFRLVELRERRDGDDSLTTREAHQVLLGTLSGTGAIGGALLIVAVAGVAWAGWRAVRRRRGEAMLALAVLVPIVLQAQVDWTASVPALAVVALAAVAVLLALAGAGAGAARGTRQEPLLAAGLALVAALLVASAMLPWGSERAVAASRTALADGDRASAIDDARVAERLNPLSPQPVWVRAEALAAGGEPGAALAAYLRAAHENPRNPAAWRLVALAARGGPIARDAWARALALDPQDERAREGSGVD